MQIPPSFLDELRNRILPSEVIRRKVSLKTNGREHTGLCPFHKEKSPSFTVSDEKGFYHCFGCGAHGDIIKFVMETEGLPFIDAIKQLAERAGMSLPEMDKRYVEREKQAKSLYDVMEEACKYFQNVLAGSSGQGACRYLERRGLKDASITKFRIGYATDDYHALHKYLKSKGISDKAMLDIGLLVRKDNGDVYDKFRGRVIFPIIDIRGRVVAFGGRILGDGKPKYLNSPETILFKKSEILYNENNARKLAFKTGKLVVAEGYMDVIALDAAGIRTAVAPLGTSVTEGHIRRLWNMAKEPVICLDGDAAGKRAMDRVANMCLATLEPGYTLKFAFMPEGVDPDDFIRKNGVSNMRSVLQNAKPLSEVLWEFESTKSVVKTPEQKAELEKRLTQLAEKVKNPTVAKYYSDYFRNRLWNFNKKIRAQDYKSVSSVEIFQIPNFDINSLQGCGTMLLMIALYSPEILQDDYICDEFIKIEFVSEKLDKLRSFILEVIGSEDEINYNNLQLHLESSGFHNDIKYLDNLKNIFLLGGDIDKSEAVGRWRYNMALYDLMSLKLDRDSAEKEMDENSETKKIELRKQFAKLESEINKMGVAFGDVN